MTPHFPLRWLRLATLFMFVGWLSIPAARAEMPADYVLRIQLSKNGGFAEVAVPQTAGTVSLERFSARLGWQRFITVRAVPGKMRFKLPVGNKASWRAVMQPSSKFPTSFYAGKHQFGPLKSNSIPAAYGFLTGYPEMMFSNFAVPDALSATAIKVGSATPVEADIWKIDGSTVYYFNQLRGLQVLDLADPADPRLTASLRLPAIGQDLYLLPSSDVGNLVLLTSDYADDGGARTRINLVKVRGRSAVITHFKEINGSLADSRLVGDRLILATRQSVKDGNDWATESRLTEWLLSPGTVPKAAGETLIKGANPLIAAGQDWLAVATTAPGDYWGGTDVTVFALRSSGMVQLTRTPIRTAGRIADRFKMQWSDNVLTTISERGFHNGVWSRTTVLENFRVWGAEVIRPAVVSGDETPMLGQLELAKGESLFAARFSGKRAYIVTFLRTDPLWVVDLSDPAAPVVAGHLEVPGWSSHLEPVGDLLFSIGWESGSIAASLFDVADPANPTLIRRLNLGSNSEAVWDDKALKVLPEQGLAMIPITRRDATKGTNLSGIQLLDLDLAGRDLRARGFIPHAFDARRAGLSGDTVISISQRGLVTADIADRDAPAVLAEVALAWPVNRVLDAGPFLVQIETGNGYGQSRATARVSPADATEEVLSETDLGAGIIRCSEIRNGRLLVLRETTPTNLSKWWGPVIGVGESSIQLDVYDATALPALTLLGSCSQAIEGRQGITGGKLLWPRPNRPCVVLEAPAWPIYYWGEGLVAMPLLTQVTSLTTTSLPILRPFEWPIREASKAPQLIAFDLSNPATPAVSATLDLGSPGTTPTGGCAAADGLLVVGTSDWKPWSGDAINSGETSYSARVVSFDAAGAPVLRPAIDLPGSLFGITSLDRAGFLAFTRTTVESESAVQISACDGYDAYLINQLTTDSRSAVAASGRRIFVASETGVLRQRLSDAGVWVKEAPFVIGWRPDTLRCSAGVLLASTWRQLYASDISGAAAAQWRFQRWSLKADQISIASGGDLLVSFGDYGAERLQR